MSALFAGAAFTSLVASLVFTSLSTTHGAADKDVRVVNTAAEPVPTLAQGTTMVAGTVQAQQGGSWSVGLAGTPTVRLGNTATSPALTRSVDEPARHAFQTTVSITIPNADGAAMGFVTVPPGQRLVVEFVSVNGNVVHGRTLLVQMSTFGGPGEVFHEVALNDPRPLGNDIYTASHLVRMYTEEQLTLRAVHSASPSGLDSHVSVGISGYLVSVP